MKVHGHGVSLSPSDLTAYLACPHLTTLSLEVALGNRKRPYTREALAQLVAEKGDLHEKRYLQHLSAQGRGIVMIELPEGPAAFEEAHVTTVAAMQRLAKKWQRGRLKFPDLHSKIGAIPAMKGDDTHRYLVSG